MTRPEFLRVILYLEAGMGLKLPDARQEVYFDTLGDLPLEALQLAAQRVLLEHRWSTFPTIAELREAAVQATHGRVKEITAAEAWDMAWRAVGRIDPEIDGSIDRACKGLPPIVVEAMKGLGIVDLCYGKEPVGVLRGQFLKMFEQLSARDRSLALLPADTRQALRSAKERRALPGRVSTALDTIRKEK